MKKEQIGQTSSIKNCRESVYSSGTVRIKSSFNLIGKCVEMSNFSYTYPLAFSGKNSDTEINKQIK